MRRYAFVTMILVVGGCWDNGETEIEPIAGSDCSPALSVSGGAFLALPCRVEYVLSGDEIL